YFFFFSSRRRHTSFSRDWSSDVCSSDLRPARSGCIVAASPLFNPVSATATATPEPSNPSCWVSVRVPAARSSPPTILEEISSSKIGRASCRERVGNEGGGGAVTKERQRR